MIHVVWTNALLHLIGSLLAFDSGSHKVQHYLEAISNDTEIIWSTTTVKTKNSTNLESGRRPKFKSVEFFVFTLTVHELLKCEKAAFHFHAALFAFWALGPAPGTVRASQIL